MNADQVCIGNVRSFGTVFFRMPVKVGMGHACTLLIQLRSLPHFVILKQSRYGRGYEREYLDITNIMYVAAWHGSSSVYVLTQAPHA